MKTPNPTFRASALLVLLALGALAAADTRPEPRDGQHDFDFFIGTWKQHNRRLKDPLTGSTTWYEFESRSVARKLWGGKANMDEFEADTPNGHIQGLTLRLYDPKAHQWSIYWANSATSGPMGVPTVGAFDASGRGEFFDQEFLLGRTILVRYLWTRTGTDACRWEQAFSTDGGKSWETNWVTDSVRVPEAEGGG
jgi:hypothetical protein